MEELALEQLPPEKRAGLKPTEAADRAEGATLRALRQLLDEVDALAELGRLETGFDA